MSWENEKLRKYFFMVVKLLVTLLILTSLVERSELSWSFFIAGFSNVFFVLLAMVFLVVGFLFSAQHWKLITRADGSRGLSYRSSVSIVWIALFLKITFPRIIGSGAQIIYTRKHFPRYKYSEIVVLYLFELVMDVISLLSLYLILTTFSLLYFGGPFQSKLQVYLYFGSLILLMISLLGVVCVNSSNFNNALQAVKLYRYLEGKPIFRKFIALSRYPIVLKLWVVSMISQFGKVSAIIILAVPFIGKDSISSVIDLSFLPLAFIARGFLSSFGVGVEYAVFQGVGSMNQINNGANFFNLYYVLLIATSLVGIVPFIRYSRRKK